MTVTFYELGENDYTEIGRIHDGEIVDGEDQLVAIGADQFADNEKKLLNVYDGPYIVAGIGTPNTLTQKSDKALRKSVETVFKDWIPYEGPQGGEGWQNTLTGEIRYQEGKPSGAGSDADVTVPGNSTIQTVSAAITSVLGATVMQSLKQQATGGGGSFNPQTFVTAAAMYIAQTGKGSLGELQEALDTEAESEPEDAQDVTIQTESGEIESTTQTGVTDVTSAITQVSSEETVARLGMTMSEEEKEDPEAWIRAFGDSVTEEANQNFQDALDERIRERTVSTDKYRGGVVVPNEVTTEQVREAMGATMDAETVEWLSGAMENSPAVDGNDPDSWVRAALTQIGDDSEQRTEFQNQFDVSAAVSEEGDGDVGTVTMSGGGESIEMPTNTSAEEARAAVEETLGQDFLTHTAGFMEDQGADVEDPKQWVMNGLTLSQIANPEGFETTVSEMQDSLIETNEEPEESRATQVVTEHDAEGDWQSFVDPVTDLLEEGESAGDIVQSLKEDAEIDGHPLQDEQIRTLAFEAHKEASERNPPGVDETPDTPSLAMDWGNEFPEAMRDRMQENHPEAYEQLNESFEPWSDDPHSEEMNSFWNYAVQHSGNGNIPEMEGRPENVTQEEVEAVQRLHEVTQDTLTELYGDTVPLFRPVGGSAASELKNAKESDEDDDIQFTHRPAESWSGDIEQIAQRTDFEDGESVVIRREVPTEDVLASSVTGSPGLDAQDNEFVVSSPTETEYKRGDVLTGDDLKDPQATMEQAAWANKTTGGTEQTEANEEGGE